MLKFLRYFLQTEVVITLTEKIEKIETTKMYLKSIDMPTWKCYSIFH